MTSGVENRHRAGVQLGTLWTESLTDTSRRVSQLLQEITNTTTIYRRLQEMTKWALGNSTEVVEKVTVVVRPGDVVQIGGDLQQRLIIRAGTESANYLVLYRPTEYDLGLTGYTQLLTEDSQILAAENGQFLLVPTDLPTQLVLTPENLYPRYAVPMPNIQVESIVGPGRPLVAGLDFVQGDDCLIFAESPAVLFPDNRILIIAGRRQRPNLLSFTLKADGLFTTGRYVTNYLRYQQTRKAFELAAAEIAGAAIMPWESILQRVLPAPRGKTYVFTDGVVTADYPHTELEIGFSYPKGLVIGGVVQVYGGRGSWWRQLDWSAGLSLDKLCPFKGIVVPDRPCTVWADTESVDIHAKIVLDGDPDAQALFWEHVQRAEIITGKYLNSVLQLPDLTARRFTNPLELMFRYLLESRALVVTVAEDLIGHAAAQRARDFINAEKPVGTIVIFK